MTKAKGRNDEVCDIIRQQKKKPEACRRFLNLNAVDAKIHGDSAISYNQNLLRVKIAIFYIIVNKL